MIIWMSNALNHIINAKNVRPQEKEGIIGSILNMSRFIKSRFNRGPERAKTFHQMVDAAVSSAKDLSCRKNCANCCHQRVTISEDEMDLIESIVDLKSLDKAHLERQATFSKQDWIEKPLDETRCIFLKEKSCSIYEDRPSACRAAISKKDPELCLPKNVATNSSHCSIGAEIVFSATIQVCKDRGDLHERILNRLSKSLSPSP